MVESPENLVLTQLRAIRADISEVQGSLGEIKRLLANLEGGQLSIIQHLGHLAAAQMIPTKPDGRDPGIDQQ